MKRTLKATATVAMIFVLAGSLSSCSSTEEFEHAQSANLPPNIVSDLGEPVAGTIRLLGEDTESVSYYVGRWADGNNEQYCLVIVESNTHSRACGDSLPITGVFQGIRATLDTARIELDSDGDEQVGDYLIVSRP